MVWESGATQSFTYDLVGNRTSSTDALNRTTTDVYNAANELVSETNPLGGVTQYGHDAVGNETSMTDPNNNTTTFQYDANDQLIKQTDPLGNSTTNAYDGDGNLTQTTDRNGRVIKYGYDALDRQTSETWLSGSTVVDTLTNTYDAAGNLLSAGDNNSQYHFTYDANDRELTSDNAGTVGMPHIVLTYGYDAVGNTTSVTDNTGVTVASIYNSRELLYSRTWSGGGVDPVTIGIGYNAAGERAELDRFAGSILVGKSLSTYDLAGRVQTLTHEDGTGNVISSYQYTHDAAGQLTQEIHHGITFTYGYDLNSQLTSATRSDQPPQNPSYDANGNRTDSGIVAGADNRITSDATYTYQYDNEGNLTQKVNKTTGDITSYTYDFRNRLTDVTTKSSGGVILHSEQYRYDVFDRRIAVTVNGVTRTTAYNGANAWADYNADGSVQSRYLFGDRADEIIARFQPGQGTAWYLADRLGTIRDLVNAGGVLIDHIDYSAFGAVLSETNPTAGDRFKFTGRELDATGLYYYRARFYDPVLGRFLSQDPLGFAAGDPNLYRYVGNMPTGGTDPSGKDALIERVTEMAGNLQAQAISIALGVAFETACSMLDAWAQNQLTNPWRTAAYGFITGFGMGARNAAWGVLMGPCGSVLTSISAPGLLITQIFSDATGLLEAWQYYKDTGDRRLLTVRSFCAGVHFILTLTQLRIILNGRACFTAGTPLLTQRGWVPIEEITTDDYVWSRPEHDPSAACEWKRVEELFTRFAQVQNLHVGGQVIGTTSEHPFWVVGQGWKKACELQKGDFLIGHDGQETPVEELFDTQVFQPVYNLRVADFHTYFVGSEEWGFSVWAHNEYDARKAMPNREKWEKKGGLVIKNDGAPGYTTYIRKDGVTVTYNPQGHPDFSPHAVATVNIGKQQGDHYHDFIAANKEVGMPEAKHLPPIEGTTWHHHQDGVTMLLVPTSIHNAALGGFPHAGGVSAGKP